ncbi:DUF1648 domain-containing protein [Paenibacillus polymyxa]|uniref:DUF1648 domain-containing protein n=1 Tax=Paenibacillus polymyxa TaxID=1406 RepID=UPI00058A0CCB|nr:DUF1648 domain-containing protein [Paenibacillus polymyxa]AJE51010.1 hypothetical protein RE92_07995 [Paenibacillus polymyxa]OAZ50663.1 hypothetical protein A9Z39_06575 [Paenibacillus polymyxa]QOH60600.1 DUF1648 domain-containing protein [Paenibacillus polymyxa]
MRSRLNILNLFSILLSIVPFSIYLFIYPTMPRNVAIHYNFNDVADRFVDKSSPEVWLLCALSFIAFVIMLFLQPFLRRQFKSEESSTIMESLPGLFTLLITLVFSILGICFLLKA